jgi:hypothetical protein
LQEMQIKIVCHNVKDYLNYKNYLTNLLGLWTYLNWNHLNSTRFMTILFTTKYLRT